MMILNDKNFEEELQKSQKPVLVDFWSGSCMPCLMLSPILEELAEVFKDQVIFAKLNIDQAPQTAQKYEIDRIPMVFLFKEGKAVSGFLGFQPLEIIKGWLDKNLAK